MMLQHFVQDVRVLTNRFGVRKSASLAMSFPNSVNSHFAVRQVK